MGRKRTEAEDNAALAKEAERLAKTAGIDEEAAESAALSEAAVVESPLSPLAAEPPTLTDAEIIPEAPPAPPWTPSKEVIPQWVVAAQRLAWKVQDAETVWKSAFGESLPADGERARWTGGDVDYRYFKGGKVLATFRPDSKHGAVFGVLKTEPVAEFDADPELPVG